MTNAQDRIAKLGIIGLAGIAILGWVRQPEMHTQPEPAQRAVFHAPQEIPRSVAPGPATPKLDQAPAVSSNLQFAAQRGRSILLYTINRS